MFFSEIWLCKYIKDVNFANEDKKISSSKVIENLQAIFIQDKNPCKLSFQNFGSVDSSKMIEKVAKSGCQRASSIVFKWSMWLAE